jgi:hypothetical protein
MHLQLTALIFNTFKLCYHKIYDVLHVSAGDTHLQDIHLQRKSGCWYVKHVSLKSLYRKTLIFIHKYCSVGGPDYINIETVFNHFYSRLSTDQYSYI